MAPRSVLVTGANRGIGLGLVKTLLKNEKIEIIFAGCRNPDEAEELKAIKDGRLHLVKLDATCDQSIEAAYKEVDEVVGEKGLNLLINNAGINVKYSFEEPPKRQDIVRQFDTNVFGIIVISQTFLPLLRRAAKAYGGDDVNVDRSAIVNISSGAGSIGSKERGPKDNSMLIYRMSKAALNQFSKTLSIDDFANDHILVASICPGWVQTDMGGDSALLTLEESLRDLVPTILRLQKEHNGGYLDRTLKTIPF
ncbi:unnamed protein product [Caenorhabditis auriculariae]|uniref:C-factor n=1 Tax=Caenorhabditis auriculariae TaxID=2777116 RepID=A0A8S1HHQ3_9PELO|nr:unnamed protein product [Caenorhabditis auriculariae]